MARFDAKANQWGKQSVDNNSLGYEYGISLEIDPTRRLLVSVGHGNVYTWDISNLNASIPSQLITTTGDNSMVGISAPGLAYDPVTQTLVAWNGGATVYILDPGTKVWTKRNPTNSVTPTAANGNGTFGRFRYCPSKNAFVAVNRVSENVFIYKLTADASAPQWYLDMLNGNGSSAEAAPRPVMTGRLLVSPSPAGKSATIRWTDPALGDRDISIGIFDPSGKLFLKITGRANSEIRWETGALPKGIYLAKAESSGRIFIGKFIIQM
jgi:hypothetical protein